LWDSNPTATIAYLLFPYLLMEINEKDIQSLVSEVIRRMSVSSVSPSELSSGGSGGPICASLDEAVALSAKAQGVFARQGLAQREKVIAAMREVSLGNAEKWAKMAVEETSMGRWEDKVKKNVLAATKTPGVEDIKPEAFTGDHGLTLVEKAPFGIIAAVTPSTNPAATIINNAISIIAAGNSVIFAPHPASKKVVHDSIKVINDAIVEAGSPSGLITTVNPPSVEFTKALLNHPEVKVNLVTGGPAIVKVAMGAGKKTIAAGPGNPPVVVDETADLARAADSIITGASFDNGVLCTAEKETIVVSSVAETFLKHMRSDARAYELTVEQMDALAKVVIKKVGGHGCEGEMNRDYVGRNAPVIARAIGLNVPDSARLLWGVVPNDHPFVWTEQLMPVMPVTVVADVAAAIKLAVEAEDHSHHTFAMHSLNVANLTEMARASQGSIFVKNGPTFMGLGMGEGYATLSIATPTGDGLTKASNFTRPLRCVLVDYFRIV
jgi:acyl-CoA reductase-like NAD-dependent aldehyde dehydrogenase